MIELIPNDGTSVRAAFRLTHEDVSPFVALHRRFW